MTRFIRKGHERRIPSGGTTWVRTHGVMRDHWALNPGWAFGTADYKAAEFLRRSNVGRGAQGCFVNPNAKCPVCSLPVFYYQNSFGSKVYFDDLGPPWPKHPCTDNRIYRSKLLHPEWRAITRRKKGEIRELIESANIMGLLHQKQFGEITSVEWTLLIVISVVRTGKKNQVSASYIDAYEAKLANFEFYSDRPCIEPGDLVSLRNDEYSFFDKTNMQAVVFQNGATIRAHVSTSELEKKTSGIVTKSAQTVKTRPFNPRAYPFPKLSRAEMAHVSNRANGRQQFALRFKRYIERYIQEGARSTEHFAVRLNADNQKTLLNREWTPRLAQFLLAAFCERETVPKKPPPLLSEELLPSTKEKTSAFERVHPTVDNFSIQGISFETLVKIYMPIINRLRYRGVHRASAIAGRLNNDKLLGDNKIHWTGETIELFLSLYQAGVRTDAGVRKVIAEETGLAPNKSPKQVSHIPENMDRTTLARLLGSIGRVTIKGDQK